MHPFSRAHRQCSTIIQLASCAGGTAAIGSAQMPKGRKPRAGQGKPKRQAAAKQGLPAAQATKAAGTKATSIASVPDADSSTKPASASGAAPSPIGLVNLGHTCYFNAVLQVLMIRPFRSPNCRPDRCQGTPHMTRHVTCLLRVTDSKAIHGHQHALSAIGVSYDGMTPWRRGWVKTPACCTSSSSGTDVVLTVQVLASAPPVQSYFLSPDQLTKKGPFGGAMREVLEASEGAALSK